MNRGQTLENDSTFGSFRDKSGFLYWENGVLYRQINKSYGDSYNFLNKSGLYEDLINAGCLIPHTEVLDRCLKTRDAFKIISPEIIPFITYPYEWSFGQLKDAAILTLKIQKKAMEYGMSLKDCSAFNIQFRNGKPIFIDTLSFEIYEEGKPWVAYRQFCQHFLAPLSLMSFTDIRLSQLSRIYIDGIPLDLASALLPIRSCFNFSIFLHIHLHAKTQKHYSSKHEKLNFQGKRISKRSFHGIIDSLNSAVQSLKWAPKGTEWADYYNDTNYSVEAQKNKKNLVKSFLEHIRPDSVWDLGANMGKISRIASSGLNIPTIAFDIDPAAIEKLYIETKKTDDKYLLPLLLDLTNPSPGVGWQNQERLSLKKRGPVDTVLALALIHHLAIGNNVPFGRIAHFFSTLCDSLIIEFIAKEDSQVEKLLANREDVFDGYSQESFEVEFSYYFVIEKSIGIKESYRFLYLMRKREIMQ